MNTDKTATLIVIADDPKDTFAIRVPDLTPERLASMDAEAKKSGWRIVMEPTEVRDFGSCDEAMKTMNINEPVPTIEAHPSIMGAPYDARTFSFTAESGGFELFWMVTGEGREGDYDPRDPNDTQLLRATLMKDGVPLMYGSVLTEAPGTTEGDTLKGMAQLLFSTLVQNVNVDVKTLMRTWVKRTNPVAWKQGLN